MKVPPPRLLKLDREALARDVRALPSLPTVVQELMMLVQKNEDCESSASRMDAVEGIRNDDNYYAKYMAGAYGAVPNL